MTEEEKIVSQETQTSVTSESSVDTDYLATIRKLKETTVPKDQYEKLRAEHKTLVEEYVNGQVPEQVKVEPVKELHELRSFLQEDGLSNIEYCKKALELRNELIKRGEKDPFVPAGVNITATFEDSQAAERVADVLQQCIDYADGDNALFTQELQRRTNDVRIRK